MPSEQTNGIFAYLRQVVRTNNAAVVAAGSKKPTSIYSLERIEDRARVIAHLSEPISKQDLSDAPSLAQFAQSEMFFGLERALESEVINGDGTGEHVTGLAHTSGVQVQPAPSGGQDVFDVTRRAVELLEAQGLDGSAWLIHPSDWATIELMRNTQGTFYGATAGQATPVDLAARQLWSKPVIASIGCTPGVAWLADWVGSTKLYLRSEAVLDWSEGVYDPNKFGTGNGGTGFEANQVVWRAELRAGLGILRPSGIVKVALV